MGDKNSALKEGLSGLNTLDPESIKGKLLISFVDKLIIGLLATMIVWFVQSEYQEHKKLQEMAFEITKIQTEYIVTYRKELARSVADFIGLIIDKDVLATGKLDNDDDQENLSRLLKKIRTTVFHLQALSEPLNIRGEDLVQAASTLYVKVISGNSTGIKIEEKMKLLRSAYALILKEVKGTTRNLLEKEYKGIDS